MTSRSFVAVFLAAAVHLASARSEAQTPATAFVNVSVIPMDRERVLRDQTVLVQGSRIIAVGSSGDVRPPAGAAVVDGQGKFLIPGLADMHMHLGESVDENESALMLYVANGVTTIRNMRGSPDHLALRARAAKGELVSPRIYTAGPTIYDAEEIATPEAAKRLVAEHQAAGYDFIKVHEIAVEPEAFDTFAAIAHRAGIPFAGHTPRRVGLERAIRAHPASLEHLSRYYSYVVNQDTVGQELTDSLLAVVPEDTKLLKLVALFKQAGVWTCPTELITKTGAKDRASGPEANVFAVRRRVIKMLHDAGAGLLLGTDGGPVGIFVTVTTRDDIPPISEVPAELELLIAAGLTPYQALETATRNPAVFLNALDSTGTIEVGKRADLVLLSGNPLEDPSHIKRPVGTMLGGHWFTREKLLARVAAADKVPTDWYQR